jgi:hypothetical protein
MNPSQQVTTNGSKFHAATRQQFFEHPVPVATNYYSPVSNLELYNHIGEQLNSAGYAIRDERFVTAYKGQVGLAILDVQDGSNDDLGISRSIAFMNSYNKMRSVKIAAGATVRVCSNGMFFGDMGSFSRRHKGKVWEDIKRFTDEQIEQLDVQLRKARSMKIHTQAMKVNYNHVSTFMGDAVLKDLLTPHMVADFKDSIHTNKDFAMQFDNGRIESIEGSVWQLYNNATEALKRSNASDWVSRHANVTNWFLEECELQDLVV